MAGEIKQKIVLEGEKEYSAALKDANRNLKTLQSAMRAETAELGKNATAQQKAATQGKNLQKQISEQEKIVKTLEAALEETREKYGDNEDAIAKWEIKLNNARTTLANMKNELDGVGQEIGSVGQNSEMSAVATKSLADAFGKLSEVGGGIADGIGSAMEGIAGKVTEVISGAWDQVNELAAKSNNLVDLAGYWNTSVTNIQKYRGAVASASGTLEDLNSIVTRINSKDPKDITELVGVSKANYKDQWEYAMAVMDALSTMDTEARNAAGFEIFGRGATKMFDLANDWATVKENLERFDPSKGGYGLSEEELGQMSALYDKINGLKASWEALQDMATVHLFGDLSLDLVGNAQGILDGFLDYFNAEDQDGRDAAIKKIEDNIQEMFGRVGTAIESGIAGLRDIGGEFQASDNPTLQAVGKVMQALADALEWFTEDNMSHVVTALETLAGFWIAGKGLQMATTVAEFAKNLAIIKGFKGFSLLGGAAAEAGAAGAAGAAAGAGASKVGWGSALFGAMRAGIPNVLAAWGVHEGVKALPANTMTTIAKALGLDTETQETVDRINAERGINTFGDLEEEIKNTPREQNQRAMRLALDTLLHPGANTATGGGPSHEFGSEIAEAIKEVVEDVDLDRDYTDEDRENAFQDWWDAWRNADQGLDSYEEEENAFAHMAEVFEDDFGDVWENINRMLDQIDNAGEMNDLPSSWWQQVTNNDPNRITSSDLQGFRNLPGMLQAAVQRGAAGGVSGIQVTLDGATVGRLVAPYVSQWIGYSIG